MIGPLRSHLRSGVLLALLAAGLAAGCGGNEPEPPTLVGTVEIARGDTLVATIDTDWIAAHPPHSSWGEGDAWRLGGLFGDTFTVDGASLLVTSESGEQTSFPNPGSRRDGQEPLLVVNRKGGALVTLADPANPGNGFHGRGGARNRPVGEAVRVTDVRRLELRGPGHSAPPTLPQTLAPSPLRVTAAAGSSTDLRASDLGELAMGEIAGRGAKQSQPYWDLRKVIEARFTGSVALQLVDGGGKVTDIDPARWGDEAFVPALRINRQAKWRFQWLDDSFAPLASDDGVRNVVELKIGPEAQ